MSRVLVTGGCGFIGSNLVRQLVQLGHEVLNFDKLTYAGNRCSLADLESNRNHKLLVADICDTGAVSTTIQSFRPDWIMHLAAESHVDRSIESPSQFIQTNVVGTYNLLRCATEYWQRLECETKSKFRFLHVSTDEVYGSLGESGRFTEESCYAPSSPYSASKASADHLTRAWHTTYDLPVLLTNCSNNYGPYQYPEKLIPVVVQNCLHGKPIPVYGEGQNIRDWLYVEDHCQALLAVVTQGRLGETYNIGGNNEKRNIDLVHLLCTIMDELSPETIPPTSRLAQNPAQGRNRQNISPLAPQMGRGFGGEGFTSHTSLITFVTDRPGHDYRYAIDSTKIRNELGWQPQQDAESGFRKTVEWYLQNQFWCNQVLSRST